jgi:hypothetical protein
MADAYVQATRLKAFAPVSQQDSNIRFQGPASPRVSGDAAGCQPSAQRWGPWHENCRNNIGTVGREHIAGSNSFRSEVGGDRPDVALEHRRR